MKINVHYTTQLRAALGRSGQTVELPAQSNLHALLGHLTEQDPEVFHQLVWDEEQRLLPNLVLTVGGQQVRGTDRPLQDGDTVTLLSAISGG